MGDVIITMMVEGDESVAVGVPLAGVVTSACRSSACA